MTREMKEEIARIRRLRDEALESVGFAASPPQSAVFDRPDEGFGYRTGKVQNVQLGVSPRAGVASDQRSGEGLSLMSFLIALIKICLLAIFVDYCT